jgi:hypothetical protein
MDRFQKYMENSICWYDFHHRAFQAKDQNQTLVPPCGKLIFPSSEHLVSPTGSLLYVQFSLLIKLDG